MNNLHLGILILGLLSIVLLLVLTSISRLRVWNVIPLSATHLQLLCHLSVCFSDCRISTTCPLPCCQAQDKRRCFLLDPFLCLSTQVFMSQSADFSLGAEAHIESPQHTSLREVLATSSSGRGGGSLSTSKLPSLSREKRCTDQTAHERVTDHHSVLDQPPTAYTDKMEAAASAEEDRRRVANEDAAARAAANETPDAACCWGRPEGVRSGWLLSWFEILREEHVGNKLPSFRSRAARLPPRAGGGQLLFCWPLAAEPVLYLRHQTSAQRPVFVPALFCPAVPGPPQRLPWVMFTPPRASNHSAHDRLPFSRPL